jgi:acyl-CoA synthetase (AMP-forming)/AMP-acid ligase II
MLHEVTPRLIIGGERYGKIISEAVEESKSTVTPVGIGQFGDWANYNSIVESSEQFWDAPQAGDNDTAMIMFTSGTSSQPKGVVLSHDSFCGFVLATVTPADPDEETAERTLLTVPLYHIAGAQALMSGVYGGRTLVLQPQFEPASWMGLVEREKVTRAMVVPTMLKTLMDHEEFDNFDLSSLEVITYGAATMPEAVLMDALENFPDAQFINAFGQTETAATITMLLPEDHRLVGTPEEIELKKKRIRSIGRPLEDVEIQIVDDLGVEVEQGATGEIIARGDRLMKGYWNMPDATSGALQGGWLHTGDLGWADEDGYIFLAGRVREFIKRGGEMISPEEVEEVIDLHELVSESAVIGLPDEKWGEIVHAVVVAAPNTAPTGEEIIDWCHERLASYKKPDAVHFVDELPRSQLGKVMKGELRAQFHNGG